VVSSAAGILLLVNTVKSISRPAGFPARASPVPVVGARKHCDHPWQVAIRRHRKGRTPWRRWEAHECARVFCM